MNYPFDGDGYLEDEAFEALEERLDKNMVHKSSFPQGSLQPPLVASKENYYDVGGIVTKDIIKAKLTEEQYKGWLLGNVLKYSSRLNWKGHSSADAKKLCDYSQWLSEVLNNK